MTVNDFLVIWAGWTIALLLVIMYLDKYRSFETWMINMFISAVISLVPAVFHTAINDVIKINKRSQSSVISIEKPTNTATVISYGTNNGFRIITIAEPINN